MSFDFQFLPKDFPKELLADIPENEWVETLNAYDEQKKTGGKTIALFLEALFQQREHLSSKKLKKLGTKAIECLKEKQDAKKLSKKANKILSTVNDFFQFELQKKNEKTKSSLKLTPSQENVLLSIEQLQIAEKPLPPFSFETLPAVVIGEIGQYLSRKEIAAYLRTEKAVTKARGELFNKNELEVMARLSHCNWNVDAFDEKLLLDLQKYSSNVHFLIFPAGISQEKLKKVIELFPQLTTVTLVVATPNLLKTLSSLQHLQSVKLGTSNISDDDLETFCKKSPNLQSFSLTESNVTDKGLETLLKTSPQLQTLSLFQCNKIKGAVFQTLEKSLTKLQQLDITYNSKISDTEISNIIQKCPNIQILNFTNCGYITDTSLQEIAKSYPNLIGLNLKLCSQITDAGIVTIAEGCKKLQFLNISECTKISDSAIDALANGCKDLHTLFLFLCYKITDKGLASIAKNLDHLKLLDLSKCDKITDFGLITLGIGCQKLQAVGLWRCNEITDNGLVQLAIMCQRLEKLLIVGCEKLTDKSIGYIKKRHPSIEFLQPTQPE